MNDAETMHCCNEFLEECELCGDVFAIEQIRITLSGHLYCDYCMGWAKRQLENKSIDKIQYKDMISQ